VQKHYETDLERNRNEIFTEKVSRQGECERPTRQRWPRMVWLPSVSLDDIVFRATD